MIREWIHVHVGQAGVQIGQKFWELYSCDNGIELNGSASDRKSKSTLGRENLDALYLETPSGKFKPRTLFLDLEPSACDVVRQTVLGRSLNRPFQVANGKEGCASNFARGYHTVGKELLPNALNLLRKEVEACSGFEGLVVTNSISGGTGSGFTSIFLRSLSTIYKKINVINHLVVPSPNHSNIITEPYNAILYLGFQLDRCKENSGHRIVPCYDNQSMYDFLGVEHRTKYEDINRLIAQTSSSMFSSFIFKEDGEMVDMDTSIHKIKPIPSMHYFVPSMTSRKDDDYSVSDLTFQLFDPKYSLLNISPLNTKIHVGDPWVNQNEYTRSFRKIGKTEIMDIKSCSRKKDEDPRKEAARKGKFYPSKKKNTYFSNLLMYRTNGKKDFSPRDVLHSLSDLQDQKGEDYNFGSYSYNFCNNTPQRILSGEGEDRNSSWGNRKSFKGPEVKVLEKSGCMLSNCDGIKNSFARTVSKFNIMYAKRSFVHWYIGEGAEEPEFGFAVREVYDFMDEIEGFTNDVNEQDFSEEEEEEEED